MKSGAGFTTRVTPTVLVKPPPTPLTTSEYVPTGVLLPLVLTVSVEPVVPGFGLKLPLAPAGSPLTVNRTDPVNPPLRPIVRAYVVDEPRTTELLEGDAVNAKFGGAVTTRVTDAVCVVPPLVPLIVNG